MILPANPAELRVEDVWILDFAGNPALIGVTMAFSAGVPVALTGPSGSGKSALCFILAGAVEPTQGSVLASKAARSHPPPAKKSGWFFRSTDSSAVSPQSRMSRLPLQGPNRAQPHDVRDASVRALALVGLADDGERLVDELSGGEHQHVGIARALAGDPRIVIADEPRAELDPDNRGMTFLERASQHRIVNCTSDNPAVVARFPRVVELEAGSVRPIGPAQV